MKLPFEKTREAIVNAAESILKEAGVVHKKHGDSYHLRDEWNSGFICPTGCGDKSGSASFSRELFLRCHQCSAKLDVFKWIAQTTGETEWDVCKRLADRLNVDLSVKAMPRGRNMPAAMNEDLVASACHELVASDKPDAKTAREFLRRRGLWDPQRLQELGIGLVRNYIVFPQRNEKGELQDRYRGYGPGTQQPWRWLGKGSGGPGAWPAERWPAEGERVLLLEGEWDVLTAIIRRPMNAEGFHPVTFTSGVGFAPDVGALPSWMHGREVHIAYDNDTFQGPNYHAYDIVTKPGQDPAKAAAAARSRLAALLETTCPRLVKIGCEVHLRVCPIKPTEKWGADFRDWVEGHPGKPFEDWTNYPFQTLPLLTPDCEELPFDEVFAHVNRRVRTTVQLETIPNDAIPLPSRSSIRCERGSANACAGCPAIVRFPDWIIEWDDFPRELATSIVDNKHQDLVKLVIRPPRGCPGVELVHEETRAASLWSAGRPQSNRSQQAQRAIHILSTERPSFTGEIDIIGRIHTIPPHDYFMVVDHLASLDEQEIDLGPYLNDFKLATPWNATTLTEIDDYLERRLNDLACHVTRIKGRHDIHLVHELLAHSTRDLPWDRKTVRGWLDVCVYGDTRTGKSATFMELLAHHRMGVHHTAVANTSRAGLVMGTDQAQKIRPGLFPKCDGKMLIMDEVHKIAAETNVVHYADTIQGARGEGLVSSAKISGDHKMPARVRYASIANWDYRHRNHQFECEHLIGLYGSPEAIGRLDFALVVRKENNLPEIPNVEHFWTADRTRMLIMRAWRQRADMVHVDQDAVDLAIEQSDAWRGVYDTETVPLYTPQEKPISLLRIATALANLCFSHVAEKPLHVIVRKIHVEWAIEWTLRMWAENGYAGFSAERDRRSTVSSPLLAEKYLTCKAALNDCDQVATVLSTFLPPFSVADVQGTIGLEQSEAIKWISHLVRLRVFERFEDRVGKTLRYTATTGGRRLILAIIRTADEDPDEYWNRYQRIRDWQPDTMKPVEPLTDGRGSDDEAVPF